MSVSEHPIPSWRSRCVIRILLIVAAFLADDDVLKKGVNDLSAHIAVGLLR